LEYLNEVAAVVRPAADRPQRMAEIGSPYDSGPVG
jgi:hypothetical protein